MSAPQQYTEKQIASGISAAFEVVAAVRDAGIKDPAELGPMVAYAEAAEQRDAALTTYRRAKAAHARFAQTHDHEDAAHEDHQRACACAQAALTTAEQVLTYRLIEWRKARGL